MRITSNSIGFQSKIRFVNEDTFYKKIVSKEGMPNVCYAWTVETMRQGKSIFTRDIISCYACGIIAGEDTYLCHLSTRNKDEAKRDDVVRFSIRNIEKRLNEKIDLTKQGLHAFIFGGIYSQRYSSFDNSIQLQQLKSMFEKYKIPYSVIGGRGERECRGDYSVMYDKDEDTWLITNSLTDTDYLYNLPIYGGHEVEVTDDGIIYRPYTSIMAERGLSTDGSRVKTNTEEYFRSHFHDVRLCELDEWG